MKRIIITLTALFSIITTKSFALSRENAIIKQFHKQYGYHKSFDKKIVNKLKTQGCNKISHIATSYSVEQSNIVVLAHYFCEDEFNVDYIKSFASPYSFGGAKLSDINLEQNTESVFLYSLENQIN